MACAVVLTGAPGAGKSSVLDALTTRLEIRSVPYGAFESEQLAWGLPWHDSTVWIPLLADVMAAQRRLGRELMVVAATTETADELRGVVAATAAVQVLVVALQAPAHVVAARIEKREPDAFPGKAALVAHARMLASVIPSLPGVDLVLDTDGADAAEVALQIEAELMERGW